MKLKKINYPNQIFDYYHINMNIKINTYNSIIYKYYVLLFLALFEILNTEPKLLKKPLLY